MIGVRGVGPSPLVAELGALLQSVLDKMFKRERAEGVVAHPLSVVSGRSCQHSAIGEQASAKAAMIPPRRVYHPQFVDPFSRAKLTLGPGFAEAGPAVRPMNTLMPNEPDYYLDVQGVEDDGARPGQGSSAGRKWIGVQFECCGIYTRIYRNAEGTAYDGCCPKCGRKAHIRVGPGGTSHRMFRAK
jgi:hypothetical protein